MELAPARIFVRVREERIKIALGCVDERGSWLLLLFLLYFDFYCFGRRRDRTLGSTHARPVGGQGPTSTCPLGEQVRAGEARCPRSQEGRKNAQDARRGRQRARPNLDPGVGADRGCRAPEGAHLTGSRQSPKGGSLAWRRSAAMWLRRPRVKL